MAKPRIILCLNYQDSLSFSTHFLICAKPQRNMIFRINGSFALKGLTISVVNRIRRLLSLFDTELVGEVAVVEVFSANI